MIHRWALMKLRDLHHSEGNCQWSGDAATKLEKCLTNCTANKELVSRIDEELYKVSFKKTNNLIKTGVWK